MELDAKQCYRALKSRDERFDGHFFTAVLTTGIYCRPVCPARTPKFQNVRFYACAAAAEEGGFRPCMRCRPETSPGTPAWIGTSATVSRALRLIEQGALDDGSIEELAASLGVGPRHLRRLFDEHLGASPMAVAMSRRVHFAKRLIDETSLAITDIAYSSGFENTRRFNAAFKKAFHRTPSEFRKKAGRKVASSSACLTLKLPYRPPFAWDNLMAFLEMRAIPGVEEITGETYRRTVSIEDVSGVIEVQNAPEGNWVLLRVPHGMSKILPQVTSRIRRLLDLRADPKLIAEHLSDDTWLRESVRKNAGLRVPGAWDGFEIAVRAILGQQVSVKGATTISGRLVEQYGKALPCGAVNGTTRLFPSPERLARAELSGIGIPGKRALAIRTIAEAVANGDVQFDSLISLEDANEKLVALPGIGPWTAQYIAMRVFGEPDAFPSGDLALLKAATAWTGNPMKERELIARAESWRPWRAYAALYLWSQLSSTPPKGSVRSVRSVRKSHTTAKKGPAK